MPPRGDIAPGRIIKAVLSGELALVTRSDAGDLVMIPEVDRASISDLHKTYKDAVRRTEPPGPGGRLPRVMTYHSFVTTFRFAIILGFVLPVAEEAMDPSGPELLGIREGQVVTQTRRLYSLTPAGGNEDDAWGNLRRAYEQAPPETTPEDEMAYSITRVHNMMATLQEWIEQSENTLQNEEAKTSPNEDRIENLTTRLDSLNTARDALDEIEPT